jgi:sugar lactone lactonase YvrE
MNFYPIPPTITAELYVRVPDDLRRAGQSTEWHSGVGTFTDIFLEGPVADDQGNLYVVDIPHGRILKISDKKQVSECARWDGEPNGLAATADGELVVADYKQVQATSHWYSKASKLTILLRASFASTRQIRR